MNLTFVVCVMTSHSELYSASIIAELYVTPCYSGVFLGRVKILPDYIWSLKSRITMSQVKMDTAICNTSYLLRLSVVRKYILLHPFIDGKCVILRHVLLDSVLHFINHLTFSFYSSSLRAHCIWSWLKGTSSSSFRYETWCVGRGDFYAICKLSARCQNRKISFEHCLYKMLSKSQLPLQWNNVKMLTFSIWWFCACFLFKARVLSGRIWFIYPCYLGLRHWCYCSSTNEVILNNIIKTNVSQRSKV